MAKLLKGKRRKTTDFSLCVICQKKDGDKGPLHYITDVGYPSLLVAVQSHDDEISSRLRPLITPMEQFLTNKPVCHKKCRAVYTHPKALENRKRSAAKFDSDQDTKEVPSSTRSSSETQIQLKHSCFICGNIRGRKGDHNLVLVASKERQLAVWQKAREINDRNMLLLIEGYGDTHVDMVAKDFRYHRNCMSNYLLKKPERPEETLSRKRQKTFEELVLEVDDHLFGKDGVYDFSTVIKRYQELLAHNGVENATSYKGQPLRQKILEHYKLPDGSCKVIIFSHKGTSSLMCSSQLSAVRLFSELGRMNTSDTEDDESDGDTESDKMHENTLFSFNSAKFIRGDVQDRIKDMRMSSRPNISSSAVETPSCSASSSDEQLLPLHMDISYEAASNQAVNSLYNHIAWITTNAEMDLGPDGRVILPPSKQQKVLNLCQDVYASIGNIPTPKHVGIALHILKETRSKQIITLLNRFGNCVSYWDSQRYVNTIASAIDEQVSEDGFFFPYNLKIGKFTQFAIDNLDFHENTKDGTTLHATTHIMYQYDNVSQRTCASFPLKKTRSTARKELPVIKGQKSLSSKERSASRSLTGLHLAQKEGISVILPDDFIWHLLRSAPTDLIQLQDENFQSLTWKGFHEAMIEKKSNSTLISYGPIFPESPTQVAVVDSSLEYCMKVSKKLGQVHTVITSDQAIYEIALALRTKHPDKYPNLILRMGGFHLVVNFMGSVGMLMKGSGVEDIFVQAGVCHLGTANKIMSGKDYYRMLRAHTLLHSAMLDLYWEAFETWLVENDSSLDAIYELDSCLVDVAKDLKEGNLVISSVKCANEVLNNLQPMLDKFRESQLCATPTAELWFMYLDMMSIVQRYIWAERIGDWEGHLQESQKMLPYLVVSGHHKYVSCLPHYINEMTKLPSTAPEVHQEFMEGNFTIRQTPGKFNAVWTDMALEKTYNRDAKTVLFRGITQKQATMDKYLKALPVLTAISEETQKMVNMSETKDRGNSPMSATKDDINAVEQIKSVVKNQMINPFNCENKKDLVNISTGEKATSLELIHAKEKGLSLLQEAEEHGYDKIKNCKIKTFTSHQQGKQSRGQQIQGLHKDESAVTRSLYLMHGLNDKEKEEAFSHEWAQYPPALFQPNNSVEQGYQMRSGNKADVVNTIKKTLQSQWQELEKPPVVHKTAYIIDAMAFIQRQQTLNSRTFGELQARYKWKLIQQKPEGCQTIHFVGDRYDFSPTVSLKEEVRVKRGSSRKEREYEINAAMAIPEWKSFLANPQNKANLLRFIGESWMTDHRGLPQGLHLIIGGILENPGHTVLINNTGCHELPELACTKHEEADTRMFAHLSYSSTQEDCSTGVICSMDSDVFVLAMYYCMRIASLKELWIEKMGMFLPIHTIVQDYSQKLSIDAEELTGILHNIYILTGCDTVSFIFGKSKARALKIIGEHSSNLAKFGAYGDRSIVTPDQVDEAISEARFFFKCLYNKPDYSGNLDTLRAHLFATTANDLRYLPPTEDAFHQHVLRALIQISINRSSHCSYTEYPDPTHFGRHVINGKLVPVLMLRSPKPSVTQKALYCKCKRGRCLRSCPCTKNKINCAVSCLCGGKPPECGRAEQSLLIQDASSDED